MSWRKRAAQPDEQPPVIDRYHDESRQDRNTIEAARFFLEQAMASGGPQAHVPAGDLMRILVPGWEPPQQPRDPLADPLTGCMPVTAPTGLDRVQEAVRRSRGGPPPPPVLGFA